MPDLPRNTFGENLPLDDLQQTLSQLGIRAGDRVLDVGGAANPLPRANAVCDLTFASSTQRNGAPTVFREDVRYVEAPAEALPFEDGEFDFVYCTQVLEHVIDPVQAARELSRVAGRGFVEVPSRIGELLFGNPTHRWIVDRDEDGLIFHRRPFIEHPLGNFLYGEVLTDPAFRRLTEVTYRNVFNHQVVFEGEITARIAPGEERFDYDRAEHAARSHFSFARNVFARSRDAEYVQPDALEAARLAPGSSAALRLLAIIQATLGRAEQARETLAPLSDERGATLRRILDSPDANPASLPLPDDGSLGEEPGAPVSHAARPLVSIVVAATTRDALRRSVESALAQDYPRVEVVAATSLSDAEAHAALGGLSMGERLTVLVHEGVENPGRLVNEASLRTRGEVLAFLIDGDRHASHHIDRLVAHMRAGGGAACHSDRVLLTGEGILGPDIVEGRPETALASLSTLVATRAALSELGALDQRLGDAAPLDYLVRLARKTRLEHVREVTVESHGPLRAGAAAAAAPAESHVPAELVRSLMAAHARESGLRARLEALEAELAALRENRS